MKQRVRKRQLYGRYGNSSQRQIWLWEAELRAWGDIVPVGREFGSPDYERLEILDAYSAGHISEQEAMQQLGIDRDALIAMVAADRIPHHGYGDGNKNG